MIKLQTSFMQSFAFEIFNEIPSPILQKYIIYGQKSFITLGPDPRWQKPASNDGSEY
jgi:hypothetical protein